MLAEKLNYWWLLVPIYKNLHTLCSRRSDAEEAETAIEKAMEAAELTGSDKYQEEIYLLASAFFESKNEYSRALEYLKKANGHTEALLLNVPSSTTKKINKSIKKALKKVSEARLQIINAQINENLQESRTLIETLEHKSYSDPLTNIFNRHALEEKLNELALNPSGKIAVIMLDIDHFKSVNDKFGHSKGDEILVKLGEILKSNCRRNREFTARFGGEEFCIIIENEELDSAVQLVRRIQKKIHDYNWHEILPGRDITASFGIAFQRTNDGRFLLNKADEALYKAKEGGRDTFRFCKAPDFQIQSL
ncbi:MAG: GGDEF domain-containing protein [Spirochaetales bacterium]|nr:GGDEF domain-containing protein [Spirochaetales bacterium]